MELEEHCGKLLVVRWDPLKLDGTRSAGVRQPRAHSQHTFTDHINHHQIPAQPSGWFPSVECLQAQT